MKDGVIRLSLTSGGRFHNSSPLRNQVRTGIQISNLSGPRRQSNKAILSFVTQNEPYFCPMTKSQSPKSILCRYLLSRDVVVQVVCASPEGKL